MSVHIPATQIGSNRTEQSVMAINDDNTNLEVFTSHYPILKCLTQVLVYFQPILSTQDTARAVKYYRSTRSNARLLPGNCLITQIIDLQTVFAINDRQTG